MDRQPAVRGVTFREALPGDEARVVQLVEQFLELTPYGRVFPPPEGYLQHLVRQVIAAKDAVMYVAIADDGRIVGLISGGIGRHALTTQIYAEEGIWFVEEEARASGAGRHLLWLLEVWATTNGATMLKMAAPAESPVGRLLELSGYSRVETAFIKPLQRGRQT